MDPENGFHLLLLRELDVVEHAPAEESVRQFLLCVGGDDDDGALLGLYGLLRLGDVELHPVQLPEKVIGKFQIRLVDLVDQQDHLLIGGEGFAQLTQLDVFFNVIHTGVSKLAVIEPLYHIVDIQAVLGFGGGFYVPDNELFPKSVRHGLGQHGLAGARLTLDEQRLLQSHGNVDGLHQVAGRHVICAAAEFCIHICSPLRGFGVLGRL